MHEAVMHSRRAFIKSLASAAAVQPQGSAADGSASKLTVKRRFDGFTSKLQARAGISSLPRCVRRGTHLRPQARHHLAHLSQTRWTHTYRARRFRPEPAHLARSLAVAPYLQRSPHHMKVDAKPAA